MTRRLVILVLAASAGLFAGKTASSTIQGALVLDGDAAAAPLQVRTDAGVVELDVEGDNMHTLQDKELAHRTWEFEGNFLPDGRFEILKMYTIVDGRRMRVTYYCEICHITSYRPGRCMCCQQPVELREIPAK